MSMLERAIAFPGALIFHCYKNISTDHSTPQIKETGKSKHYWKVAQQIEVEGLKISILGEINTLNQKITF